MFKKENKMKRLALSMIAILIISMALISCKGGKGQSRDTKSGDKGVVKLLKAIHHGEGISTVFEYDDKNRIIKMATLYPWDEDENEIKTFSYHGDDLVGNFVRNGNVLTSEGTTLTLDNDGNIIKYAFEREDGSGGETTHQYSDGNLIKSTSTFSFGASTEECKYDDKKNPYSCNTPKWVIQYYSFPFSSYGSKNNAVEFSYTYAISEDDGVAVYGFSYDEDGYPTEVQWGNDFGDNWWCGFEYFE